MSMMEHVCKQCGASYYNNEYSPGKCCICGGMAFNSISDEEPNFYDDDKPRDEEE